MLIDQLASPNEAKLQELCDEGCGESVTLDFKRDLPGASDKDKQEFLKGVCTFANADGGDLVYGITEQNGAASDLADEFKWFKMRAEELRSEISNDPEKIAEALMSEMRPGSWLEERNPTSLRQDKPVGFRSSTQPTFFLEPRQEPHAGPCTVTSGTFRFCYVRRLHLTVNQMMQ
jgi:Putative DNA-binding domain